jgi:isopentenyl diphosphate isomerase/L-lactate dehydrogenase-like FMN-dependent dehydrogenase
MQAKVTAAPVRIANATDVTWDDVRRLRDMWPGTLALKGILAPQDAIMAERCSVDGIIVSNHGGRNLDSATPAILALPAIRAAVSERMTVLVDGGMRRGSDILKGMALGADAVLIGKAALYALAAGGEDGVSRALGFFRDELDRTLALCGARTPEEGRTRVVKPQASFASDKGEHHGGPCTRQDVAEPFQ